MPERFPLQSAWGSPQDQEAWREQLERTGVKNVRIRLMQHAAGSGGSIPIGNHAGITKGFIEEWVTWHELREQEAEEAHRVTVTWWTKAAALGALAAALFTLIGAAAAVGQAIFAWRALPPHP